MALTNNKTALVTGSSGFIVFYLSKSLLAYGWKVVGIDNLSDYYAVAFKRHRQEMLLGRRYGTGRADGNALFFTRSPDRCLAK
jgi:nucleoside-diphosphate-sugar epimerase